MTSSRARRVNGSAVRAPRCTPMHRLTLSSSVRCVLPRTACRQARGLTSPHVQSPRRRLGPIRLVGSVTGLSPTTCCAQNFRPASGVYTRVRCSPRVEPCGAEKKKNENLDRAWWKMKHCSARDSEPLSYSFICLEATTYHLTPM